MLLETIVLCSKKKTPPPRADLDIKIDVWQSFKFLNKAF